MLTGLWLHTIFKTFYHPILKEYDVPKPNLTIQPSNGQTFSDEENIYVNTLTSSKSNKLDNRLHLSQDDVLLKSSDFGSQGGDDRSSGYR